MYDDPIVAEIRRIREEYATQFNHDLDGIFQDLKACERASGRSDVRLPPGPSKRRGKRSESR